MQSVRNPAIKQTNISSEMTVPYPEDIKKIFRELAFYAHHIDFLARHHPSSPRLEKDTIDWLAQAQRHLAKKTINFSEPQRLALIDDLFFDAEKKFNVLKEDTEMTFSDFIPILKKIAVLYLIESDEKSRFERLSSLIKDLEETLQQIRQLSNKKNNEILRSFRNYQQHNMHPSNAVVGAENPENNGHFTTNFKKFQEKHRALQKPLENSIQSFHDRVQASQKELIYPIIEDDPPQSLGEGAKSSK